MINRAILPNLQELGFSLGDEITPSGIESLLTGPEAPPKLHKLIITETGYRLPCEIFKSQDVGLPGITHIRFQNCLTRENLINFIRVLPNVEYLEIRGNIPSLNPFWDEFDSHTPIKELRLRCAGSLEFPAVYNACKRSNIKTCYISHCGWTSINNGMGRVRAYARALAKKANVPGVDIVKAEEEATKLSGANRVLVQVEKCPCQGHNMEGIYCSFRI